MESMYIYANARQMRQWLEDQRRHTNPAKTEGKTEAANNCNCDREKAHVQSQGVS